MKRVIIFEGIGWDKAKSAGNVGNCRIGATFRNNQGQTFYIELCSIVPHKHSLKAQKHFEIAGWVQDLCLVDASGRLNPCAFDKSSFFEWNLENILKIINSSPTYAGATEIRVSDKWNRFTLNPRLPGDNIGFEPK